MTDLSEHIDAVNVPLKCGKCGEDLSRTVSKIRATPTIHCRKCGAVRRVTHGELDAMAKAAQKTLDDFARKISKTMKLER
jgi:uncharacterized Zn finger protein